MYDEAREKLTLVEPVGYLDFVRLQDCADVVATDSGGRTFRNWISPNE